MNDEFTQRLCLEVAKHALYVKKIDPKLILEPIGYFYGSIDCAWQLNRVGDVEYYIVSQKRYIKFLS